MLLFFASLLACAWCCRRQSFSQGITKCSHCWPGCHELRCENIVMLCACDGKPKASQQLSHGLTPTTYTEMTAADIVSKIAKRNSLTAKTSITGKKMTYFLQLDSDHATLDELARRNGAEWWVDDTTLNFTKRTLKAPIKLKWGTTAAHRLSGAPNSCLGPRALVSTGWQVWSRCTCC